METDAQTNVHEQLVKAYRSSFIETVLFLISAIIECWDDKEQDFASFSIASETHEQNEDVTLTITKTVQNEVSNLTNLIEGMKKYKAWTSPDFSWLMTEMGDQTHFCEFISSLSLCDLKQGVNGVLRGMPALTLIIDENMDHFKSFVNDKKGERMTFLFGYFMELREALTEFKEKLPFPMSITMTVLSDIREFYSNIKKKMKEGVDCGCKEGGKPRCLSNIRMADTVKPMQEHYTKVLLQGMKHEMSSAMGLVSFIQSSVSQIRTLGNEGETKIMTTLVTWIMDVLRNYLGQEVLEKFEINIDSRMVMFVDYGIEMPNFKDVLPISILESYGMKDAFKTYTDVEKKQYDEHVAKNRQAVLTQFHDTLKQCIAAKSLSENGCMSRVYTFLDPGAWNIPLEQFCNKTLRDAARIIPRSEQLKSFFEWDNGFKNVSDCIVYLRFDKDIRSREYKNEVWKYIMEEATILHLNNCYGEHVYAISLLHMAMVYTSWNMDWAVNDRTFIPVTPDHVKETMKEVERYYKERVEAMQKKSPSPDSASAKE